VALGLFTVMNKHNKMEGRERCNAINQLFAFRSFVLF
jgi:hypothetical protein